MSDLLIRPEVFRNRIEDFGFEYLSLESRQLEQGERFTEETGANELAIVVLGGTCSIREFARRVAADRQTRHGLRRPALHALYAGEYDLHRLAPARIAISPSATVVPKRNIRRIW